MVHGVESIVRLRHVSKSYGAPPALVQALSGVTLDIARGERLALLGRSGSGKSTLLNLLGGLDRPTQGSIEVAGRDLAKMSGNQLAAHRLHAVGMVFQSYNLLPSRSAAENVELPLRLASAPSAARRRAAREALDDVGLARRASHFPAELSGGECQRVALARALINRPAIVLADEPTGSLDSATAAEVMALLLDHVRRHGAALVLVTHDEELAAKSTDRVVRLRDGRLSAEGEGSTCD